MGINYGLNRPAKKGGRSGGKAAESRARRAAKGVFKGVLLTFAFVSFNLMSSSVVYAHCKAYHPQHCLGKVASGAKNLGKKIVGRTKKSAKAVWKNRAKPYQIIDKTIPSPIPFAVYVLRNPDEIIKLARNPTNIVGAPLAGIIADSRNKVLKRGTRPLPIEVRPYFEGKFSKRLLNSVRYTTGNSIFNGIAPKISLSTQAVAVTLMNVIVFKKSTGRTSPESIKTWAHELYHVRQYERMGLLKFAKTLTVYGYKNTKSPIEKPAYKFDTAFSGMISFTKKCNKSSSNVTACWTREFSEERPGKMRCGRNMAVAGLWCSGKYCDNKSLYCKRLPPNRRAGKTTSNSKWISEEKPNASFRVDRGKGGKLVSGLKCKGKYCDNISAYTVNTNLVKTGQWKWLPFFSEEQGGKICGKNQYVTGVGCKGSYCDNISLLCSSVR